MPTDKPDRAAFDEARKLTDEVMRTLDVALLEVGGRALLDHESSVVADHVSQALYEGIRQTMTEPEAATTEQITELKEIARETGSEPYDATWVRRTLLALIARVEHERCRAYMRCSRCRGEVSEAEAALGIAEAALEAEKRANAGWRRCSDRDLERLAAAETLIEKQREALREIVRLHPTVFSPAGRIAREALPTREGKNED